MCEYRISSQSELLLRKLASLHVTNSTTTHLFPPWDSRILSTLNSLINTFEPLYPINTQSVGVGIGRYPEDIYNGVGTSQGNPWCFPNPSPVFDNVGSSVPRQLRKSFISLPSTHSTINRFLQTRFPSPSTNAFFPPLSQENTRSIPRNSTPSSME